MSNAPSQSLEIQIKTPTGWEIASQYPSHAYSTCLAAAQEMYNSRHFDAVRVLKETYDETRNTAREEVVYRSPCRPRQKPSVSPLAQATRARPRNAAARRRPARRLPAAQADRKNTATGPGMAEISLIFLGSTVMLSFIVAAALQYFNGTAIAIFTPRYRYMVALVFVTSFVSVFIPLMLRYGPSLFRSGRKPPPMPAGREISVAPKPRAVDDALPRPDRGDTTEESQSPDRILTGKAEPHEELAAEPAEDASPPDPSVAKVSAALLNFTGHSLEAIAATDRQLDSFNRFGLTLFFAGAADCLASSERLSEGDIEDLLRTQMQMLGHTPEMATRFCANMVDYLVNPKNFTMYEAGRAAVVRYQRQPKNEAGVVAAMERWTNPDAPVAKNAKEFVAILFTDIVGSTAMTQERGDDGAQLVVHKHNEIVRDALAQHGGREIKHTGDGIMATFPQIASSVDCAISMQKQCARANAADAGLGLVLSIGINAGEPIHERGDIFGTPVQMAARVLGKAEGNEIAVSNIVREMCAGKSYAITKKGDYELKGFADPVPVYLVGW